MAATRGVLWSRAAAARAGRDPPGGGHRPRHRVVPQRPVAGLQVVGRARPRAARPVRAARGGPGGDGRRRLADGRARGRRRPGQRGRRRRRRPEGRAGGDLHPRQGPRPVRPRRPGGAARPAQPGRLRRGRGDGQVRRRPRPRSPTTWPWSATRPTASPACPGGGPSRPPPCSPTTATIEQIPDAPGEWAVAVRGRPALAATLRELRRQAMLFKDLATLRVDRSLLADVGRAALDRPHPGVRRGLRAHRRRLPGHPGDRVAGQRVRPD